MHIMYYLYTLILGSICVLQAAIEMQKGWWEVRMIMNEFSMLRSFNPRLLQAGNFGFTYDEMLAALGHRPAGFEESEAARVSHIERQLDMERQQVENPGMFPVAGRHGSSNDAESFRLATAAGLAPATPGADILGRAAPTTPPTGTAATAAPEQREGTVQVTTADGRIEYRPNLVRPISPLEVQMQAEGSPMADMLRDPEVQKLVQEMQSDTSGGKR
jgi:hypothetical protein